MRTISATVVAAALLAVVTLGSAPSAGASGPSLSVSPTSGAPGTSVSISGSGFCIAGCTPVSVEFNGVPVRQGVNVSATGSFQVTVEMTGAAGSVEVLATQQNNVQTYQAISYFDVTPDRPAPGPAETTPEPATTLAPSTPTTTSTPGIGPTPSGSGRPPGTGARAGSSIENRATGRPGSGPSNLAVVLGVLIASTFTLAAIGYRRFRARRR